MECQLLEGNQFKLNTLRDEPKNYAILDIESDKYVEHDAVLYLSSLLLIPQIFLYIA